MTLNRTVRRFIPLLTALLLTFSLGCNEAPSPAPETTPAPAPVVPEEIRDPRLDRLGNILPDLLRTDGISVDPDGFLVYGNPDETKVAELGTLVTFDGFLSELVSFTTDDDPIIRQAAAVSLTLIPLNENVIVEIINILGHEDKRIPWTVAQSLFEIELEIDIRDKLLTEMLWATDSDNLIRKLNAVYAIGLLNTSEFYMPVDIAVVPDVIDALHSDDEDIKHLAARALSQVNWRYVYNAEPSEVVPELISMLGSDDMAARVISSKALRPTHEAGLAAAPLLIENLQSGSADLVIASARALGYMGAGADIVVPVLLEGINSSIPSLKNEIITTLGLYGPDAAPAVPALIEILENRERDHYSVVFQTLGMIGPAARDAVPILTERLSHLQAREDMYCADALVGIGEELDLAWNEINNYLYSEEGNYQIAINSLYRIGMADPQYKQIIYDFMYRGDYIQGDIAKNVIVRMYLTRHKSFDEMFTGMQVSVDSGDYEKIAELLSWICEEDSSYFEDVVDLLDHNEETVVLAACEALGDLGAAAESAIPDLERIAIEDEPVGSKAIETINRINNAVSRLGNTKE